MDSLRRGTDGVVAAALCRRQRHRHSYRARQVLLPKSDLLCRERVTAAVAASANSFVHWILLGASGKCVLLRSRALSLSKC